AGYNRHRPCPVHNLETTTSGRTAMEWEGRRESENIEDRRGQGSGRRRAPLIVGGGLGTLLILILSAVFLGDPLALFQQGPGGPQGQPPDAPAGQADPQDDELRHFVGV